MTTINFALQKCKKITWNYRKNRQCLTFEQRRLYYQGRRTFGAKNIFFYNCYLFWNQKRYLISVNGIEFLILKIYNYFLS